MLKLKPEVEFKELEKYGLNLQLEGDYYIEKNFKSFFRINIYTRQVDYTLDKPNRNLIWKMMQDGIIEDTGVLDF
jgi:hypothetical protein